MSRHQREFIELRKQALMARKERFIRRTDSAVPTLPIIAQKLMTTSMISGRDKHYPKDDNNSWQREDRVPSLRTRLQEEIDRAEQIREQGGILDGLNRGPAAGGRDSQEELDRCQCSDPAPTAPFCIYGSVGPVPNLKTGARIRDEETMLSPKIRIGGLLSLKRSLVCS